MADFVWLADKAIHVNRDHVIKLDTRRSNRIDFLDGGHDTLTDKDAETFLNSSLKSVMDLAQATEGEPRPRRRGRPRKTT